jgi:hypothetical protein
MWAAKRQPLPKSGRSFCVKSGATPLSKCNLPCDLLIHFTKQVAAIFYKGYSLSLFVLTGFFSCHISGARKEAKELRLLTWYCYYSDGKFLMK